MAQVPDQVLAWLWSVTRNYRYPELVNGDVINTLGMFPILKPKTATFTYESGHSALLLCLAGALTVTFRGTPYRYPIEIWIPEEYGEAGVGIQCFVKPADGAVIRPGQHVAHDGSIYHPYLSSWNYNRQPSSIVEFLSILQDVFAKEPPLAAAVRPSPKTSTVSSPSKPPLPPKGTPVDASNSTRPASRPESAVNHTGPPLPPLPPQLANRNYQNHSQSPQPSNSLQPAQGSGSASRYSAPLPLPTSQLQDNHDFRSSSTAQNPSSAGPPRHSQYAREQAQPQPQRPYSGAYDMRAMQNAIPQPSQQNPAGQIQQQHMTAPAAPYIHPQYQPNLQQTAPQPQSAAIPRAPKPQQDLLTDPFDISLPTVISPTGPPPPLPPNPEREHLCMLLSNSLTTLANAKIDRNRSALAPLQAQNLALQEAHAKLTAELAQVQAFDAALSNNEPILHQSLRDCDSVIASSKTLPEPNIDETLVAPTVAAQQLWGLCADEVAIREAMWCLQRAVGAGRISGADFVKLTRGLAREAFLKLALIRRIATGLGLDIGVAEP